MVTYASKSRPLLITLNANNTLTFTFGDNVSTGYVITTTTTLFAFYKWYFIHVNVDYTVARYEVWVYDETFTQKFTGF